MVVETMTRMGMEKVMGNTSTLYFQVLVVLMEPEVSPTVLALEFVITGS